MTYFLNIAQNLVYNDFCTKRIIEYQYMLRLYQFRMYGFECTSKGETIS